MKKEKDVGLYLVLVNLLYSFPFQRRRILNISKLNEVSLLSFSDYEISAVVFFHLVFQI